MAIGIAFILFSISIPGQAAGYGVFRNARCEVFLREIHWGENASAQKVAETLRKTGKKGPEKVELTARLQRLEWLETEAGRLKEAHRRVRLLVDHYNAIQAESPEDRTILWANALEDIALQTAQPRSQTLTESEIILAFPSYLNPQKPFGSYAQLNALVDLSGAVADLALYHFLVSEQFIELPLTTPIFRISAERLSACEKAGFQEWNAGAIFGAGPRLNFDPRSEEALKNRARKIAANPNIPQELRRMFEAHLDFLNKYPGIYADAPLLQAVTMADTFLQADKF